MRAPHIISVALCTHNGAQFIEEQLLSILAQTLPPVAVVLSDDASTDDTVAIAEKIWAERGVAKPKPALRILRNQKALGVTKNFEQALLACEGDLVALSDQDDLWVPDRLERMATQFDARAELTLLHSDARLVDGHGNPLGGTLSEAIGFSAKERRQIGSGAALDVLLRRNVVTGATTVLRRSLLDAAVPFPEAWVHDEWLAIVAAITGRVDFLPEALTDYRQHGSNQIGAAKPTLGDKVSRVREPRAQRNRRLLARAASLETRLEGMPGIAENVRLLIGQKRRHEEMRSGLPDRRFLRVIPILQAAVRGDYRRFGRPRYDILRDLMQPSG